MTLPRDLAQATEAHLQAMIAAQAAEGSYLDIKRELPGSSERDKHEVLADVSAFANSSGGDILYGVDEDAEGRASAITPLTSNPDVESRRLQDVLLHGLEPRVPGLQVHPIPVAGGFVLAIRVPQSWAGPHRVRTNQHFFIRENGRKRQLDVPEVRGLFLRSENQAQRVRDFRTDRLGKILSGEAPHRLVPGALLVGHFVPTQAALGTVQVDPVPYMQDRYLPVLGNSIQGARVNADGALVIRNPNAQGTHGYSQLFRNGYFETVSVLPYETGTRANLASVGYEEHFVKLLARLRDEYTHLGIGLEMSCMLSILDAKNVQLAFDSWRYHLEDYQGHFDRSNLALPDVLLPADLTPDQALRPIFDLVWQAAGLEGSMNYNEEGQWAPPR